MRLPSALGRLSAAASLLLVASPAWALSCDEIMTMLNVSVPIPVVLQTMEGSGHGFSATDIQCLAEQGAPAEVVAKARSLAMSEAPTERPSSKPAAGEEDMDDEGAPDAFDDERMLGPDEDALPEEGEPDDASGSAKLDDTIRQFRAKKYISSSYNLYMMLENQEYSTPQEESKIHYYMARSLLELGMYHSAQHYFMQVVKRGPADPYFKYALPKLVAIAQLTGDDSELLRIVSSKKFAETVQPDTYPAGARNQLHYLNGRKQYERGELSGAAKSFGQVSAKSDLYMRAKYFEGVIHNERGKLKSAVRSFREVIKHVDTPATAREARENQELRELSLMNIARIYYGLRRFDTASDYYTQVARDSGYWADSLFENAWSQFMQNDYNQTLGLLLTVRSPYYGDQEYLPEATILRALTYFSFCDHPEVEKVLLRFEDNYTPLRVELKDFLGEYSSEEGLKLADQAFDSYFGGSRKETTLPKSFFLKILRNRDLGALVHTMAMMDTELDLIEEQRGAWRDTVGSHLKQVMEEDRVRYKQRAGRVMLKEMAEEYRALSDLLTQSEIIRFEVVDAQRQDYMYKMQNPTLESDASKIIDFATSKDIIYWPFNGEFWKDELGYYRYTEKSICR